MTGLRLEIDLDKIGENAEQLIDRAAARDVSITAVTKALLGDARLAHTLADAGVAALGDSRIENIERMRHAHVDAPMVLIRTPMLSQVDRVVRSNTMSVNTDRDVLSSLADAARVHGRTHDVMVMVELGDLREGVMPIDLNDIVRHILRHPTLHLRGIGANLACRHGVEPSDDNMGVLSRLVDDVETTFGIEIDTVSGGNSANLSWLASTDRSDRVNNLRLGESILLGRDPLDRRPIDGLHTDSIALVAEVIESQRKPTRPWGRTAQSAFGAIDDAPSEDGTDDIWQTIVAAGRQDVDHTDIRGPANVDVLAASSDHLVLHTPAKVACGSEIRFEPGYSALLRAMTSPYVDHDVRQSHRDRPVLAASSQRPARRSRRRLDDDRPRRLTLVPRPTETGEAAPTMTET